MERIFYHTDLVDRSGLPVYVFDSTYLPSPEEIDYENLIIVLMKMLPSHPYALVMFNSGLNKINWLWGLTFTKSFLANPTNQENLRRVVTVHDGWFIRTLTQVISDYQKAKRNIEGFLKGKKTSTQWINCANLSELNQFYSVQKIKISVDVYKHDYQLNDISRLFPPLITKETTINPEHDPVFSNHFYQIFNIIDLNAKKIELIFHKPGNKLKSDIFYDCINRNQVIWINDWDIYSISSTFKRLMMGLSQPLIDISVLTLPMADNYEYTEHAFRKNYDMKDSYSQVFIIQFFSLCHQIASTSLTKHTYETLSKCLTHCLCQQMVSSKNQDTIIAKRFIKNVFEHWQDLKQAYTYSPIEENIDATEIDESYNVSYDITNHEFNHDNSQDLDSQEMDEEMHSQGIRTAGTEATELTNGLEDLSVSSDVDENSFHHKFDDGCEGTRPKDSALIDISNYKLRPLGEYKLPYLFKPLAQKPNLVSTKKPVVRGRKVGQLTRIFEERALGIELLDNLH